MEYLLIFESFLENPKLSDNGGTVVWENTNVYITVNNISDGTYICIFSVDNNKRVGKLSLVSERYIDNKIYRKVDLIDIKKEYRNHGYGYLLYKVALKYLREDINGICSHLPNRSNKTQVPRIYKRLNSWNDGGDYEYIDRDVIVNESNKYNSNIQSQMDELLDKINDNGFNGLSDEEKNFMRSFKKGKERESYQALNKKVYEDGIFKFTLNRVINKGDGKIFYGTLEVNGKKFNGYINHMENGMNDPQFNGEDDSTLWDHADGYEYYLDDFIENIVLDNE